LGRRVRRLLEVARSLGLRNEELAGHKLSALGTPSIPAKLKAAPFVRAGLA
jgi:hypothetical protein